MITNDGYGVWNMLFIGIMESVGLSILEGVKISSTRPQT